MNWKDIIKAEKKPDYLDFDKDGDKEEPMTEALESAKKSEYKSKRCEGCNSKIEGTKERCKKCEGSYKRSAFTR